MSNFITDGYATGVFPLQTNQSLADRWGLSRQTVHSYSTKHPDFPKPIEGIIAETAKPVKVYAFNDVRRYEKARGLKVQRKREKVAE